MYIINAVISPGLTCLKDDIITECKGLATCPHLECADPTQGINHPPLSPCKSPEYAFFMAPFVDVKVTIIWAIVPANISAVEAIVPN